MWFGFPPVHRLIVLQFKGRQIGSAGIGKLQVQNVTKQLGVISAHLLLAEQVYLLTAFSPHLLLSTIADNFRMPNHRSAPCFETVGIFDDSLQLRLDVQIRVDAVPKNFEEFSRPTRVSAQESFPAVPISRRVGKKGVVAARRKIVPNREQRSLPQVLSDRCQTGRTEGNLGLRKVLIKPRLQIRMHLPDPFRWYFLDLLSGPAKV